MRRYEEIRDYKNEQEHDEVVEEFLRENDPLFTYGRNKLEYPYLTENQLKRGKRKHIPFSPDFLDVVK